MGDCKHCNNGFFYPNSGGHYFGQDVECVNGVLIDIDVYYEGWARDTILPIAPCHPMWKRQCAGDQSFYNDSLERLEATLDATPQTKETGDAE